MTTTTVDESAKRKRDDTDYTERLTKLARMTVQDAIEVTVGPAEQGTQKTFLVNKEIICNQSPSFKKACDAAQEEGSDLSFELPDHAAVHFQIYINWVYTKPAESTPELVLLNVDGKVMCLSSLLYLWVLGRHIGDIELKNVVIRSLCGLRTSGRTSLPRFPKLLQYIMENTTPKSKLRLWLFDELEARFESEPSEGVDQWVKRWPQDLVVELLKRSAARARARAAGVPIVPRDLMKYLKQA